MNYKDKIRINSGGPYKISQKTYTLAADGTKDSEMLNFVLGFIKIITKDVTSFAS